ncbi:MAG: helix-turn-helix transcriptional regulator [Capnocytophaga sp.]|nr:helix-turn-helix transcriptional regulator [Capnocytophaga sp.]
MINTADFIKRLQEVMNYYNINASSLADMLDIQRSSISHLLSERNKPSLEFIMKLIEQFPEVDFHWITQGKGNFPTEIDTNPKIEEKKSIMQTNLFDDEPIKSEPSKAKQTHSVTNVKKDEGKEKDVIIYPSSTPTLKEVENISVTKVNNQRSVKKIVFFYDDNSFEVFEN